MKYRSCAALVLSVLLAQSACECNDTYRPWKTSEEKTAEKPERRVVHESKRAPYTVELPKGWSEKPTEQLNEHADLAATRNDRLFLIVIPQKLPAVESVDVHSLKEASVARMRKRVDDLEIEREGPVTLKRGSAVSVFAEGVADGHPVQYVATFVTHGQWGYQIVAWGPADAEVDLIDDVDAFVGGWQFRSDSLRSDATNAARPDASTPETD